MVSELYRIQKRIRTFYGRPFTLLGRKSYNYPMVMFFVVSYFKNRLVDSSLNDHELNSRLAKYARNELNCSLFSEKSCHRKKLPVCDFKSGRVRGLKKD